MEFNRHASRYEAQIEEAISFAGLPPSFFLLEKARELLELADRRLGTRQELRIAEVGCGIGSMTRLLIGDGRHVTGTDPAVGALHRAITEVDGATFSASEGAHLPYPDGCFDLVFAVSVLHHVRPERRAALMADLVRVTRTDGIVAVFEHNPWNPLTRKVVSRCEFDRDAILLGAGELAEGMRSAGLTDLERGYILFLPWSGRFSQWFQRQIRWLPLGAQYLVAGRREGIR